MNAEQILHDLEERDVAFSVAGDRLRIEAPHGILTEDLCRTLREQKDHLVELVRHRPSAREVSIEGASDQHESLASMTIEEFSGAGLVVRIWSRTLDCSILLASDNAVGLVPFDSELPLFRASEMLRLALLRPVPRTLQTIHDVKTVFDGVICHVE